MKKIFGSFFALGIAVMLLPTARATNVVFNTDGCFGSSCTPASASSVTSGGATIQFNSDSTGALGVDTPTFDDLGTFTTEGTIGSGSFSAEPFTLTVTQTAPPGGTGTLSASISGTLSVSGSTAIVTFSTPTSVTLDGVTYSLILSDITGPNQLSLNPPNVDSGVTNIEANITSVPEPVTTGVIGGALALMALVVRRRSAKKA